ncbi:MAG: 50S ribosomal protein L10 [Sedimentisphaerales bacterium]|nr:MAG: 50S ribosomal protein L10 [Planctomycetes bacterium GWC2_45_44]HBG78831.1 50S ribosomal protein L10 [Phycisphaerales bacterium]HBR20493.1 50S ribosomal protein L10 [Phycisphaerales bacterium]
MSRYIKDMLAKELEGKFAAVKEFLVVDMTGIDGITNNQLRGKLGAKGIKLTMVRNAMMRQAAASLGMAAATSLFATGCCTIAYGADNVVDLAKELKATAGKTVIKFKGAYLEGAALDAKAAANLVNMKSRIELQGDIVMLAKSPASRLASAIASPAGRIAGCIKTIADKAPAVEPEPTPAAA